MSSSRRRGTKSSHQNWLLKSSTEPQGENHQLSSVKAKVREPNSEFIQKDQKPHQDCRNRKRVSQNGRGKKSKDEEASREVDGIPSSCGEQKLGGNKEKKSVDRVEEVERPGDVDDVWRRMEELLLSAEEPKLSAEQLRINDQAQEDENFSFSQKPRHRKDSTSITSRVFFTAVILLLFKGALIVPARGRENDPRYTEISCLAIDTQFTKQ